MNERPEQIRSGDLTLKGRLALPSGAGPFPAVVVCHPHPQYGGDMGNTVITGVSNALVSAGVAALRFNFRGVGGSGGRFDQERGEREDVVAALAHLAALPEVDGDRIGLAGYSFGAAMALAAAGASVRALALISLPLSMLDRERLSAFSGARLTVSGGADPLCPAEALASLGVSLGSIQTRIVPGADHSWFGYERELTGLIAPFFTGELNKEERR